MQAFPIPNLIGEGLGMRAQIKILFVFVRVVRGKKGFSDEKN